GLRRLAVAQTPKNLSAVACAVADVHLLLHDRCEAIAERVNDTPPVWVAAVPACFHQWAVGYGARRGISLGHGLRSIHPHGHDAVNAFAIAHNHLRKFKTDMTQCGLENRES